MTRFILDSDTSIFCLRKRHGIAGKIRDIGVWNCCISQVTVAELRYGAERSDYIVQRHREVDVFCKHISVVPINDEIINIYASQRATERRKPMNFLYGRFIGYLISFVIVAIQVLIKAIKWIKEYKKNQTDFDNDLERKIEILKYKNKQNQQKGKPKHDN
jgi:tRNA(fMet)-specific endonuclease VapC